jgi:hypothetical protein
VGRVERERGRGPLGEEAVGGYGGGPAASAYVGELVRLR